LLPSEIHLHREVRLRALQDAPNSFGEIFEDVESRPLSYWEDQTRAVTVPGRNAMFLACDEEAAHGMIYGLLDRERNGGGRVGGMWVAPAWRRQGFGRALLDAVISWAGERSLNRLGLWAPTHSLAAMAFYKQAGFHEIGDHRPLPHNPELQIIEMMCEL
jgi:GNAT superfamily N-acetyltransferase